MITYTHTKGTAQGDKQQMDTLEITEDGDHTNIVRRRETVTHFDGGVAKVSKETQVVVTDPRKQVEQILLALDSMESEWMQDER